MIYCNTFPWFFQEVFEKNYTCKKGNFNRPFEYIVFQMGEISINPLEINEVSVH